MKAREAQRLARMVAELPRRTPKWVTPEMVVAATPLDGLDLIARSDMRTRRISLLIAVARTAVDDLMKTTNADD
ncbi:hypothetical protein [Actinoplanes sp. URMC 104]|uniref:hypothetical protein n=1 Tax=Actinoplanes sp. URMC 104 TaxID=3423409 RepID=UPI003F1D03B6